VKYIHVTKLFGGNCAHTRPAGLPKVAKSRGKRGRPAATTGVCGIDRLHRRACVVYIGRWNGLGV